MDIYKQRDFSGPVSVQPYVQSLREALWPRDDARKMGNGTAIFTRDGDAAVDFWRPL